jgi:hypothetical protein
MHLVPRALARSSRLAAVVALAAFTWIVPAGLAQTPVTEANTQAESHPAHIHSGTCDQLGDVVVPLTDLAVPADTTHPGRLSCLLACVS